MINRIIQFSINNKFAIGLFTIALILYGSYSATQLPIDAVPDITNNQVQVFTLSPSLAAQEVEQFVTAPIERSLASLPDLLEVRSISRFGLSVITVVFEDQVDIYFARTLVDQRIEEAQEEIPPGMGKPEMGPVSTGLGEIYQYVVHVQPEFKGRYTDMQLREMQDWIVARQLIGTPGVAEVISFGGHLKQYEVAVDPLRLKSMNVSIPEVFEALQKNNENTGGAYIEKSSTAYYIRGIGLVKSLDDIGKIVVKTSSNSIPVLIRDVATLQLGSANRYGAMTRNGEGEVSGGVVMMLKGANSAQVVKAIKEKIQVIQKSLPEGVIIEPFLDRSSLVKRAIGTVETNLIEGALIVILILVLFLGNLRAGLIVASVIPLSMLFALILMNLFGVTGNLMSLGAIDFGLLVDGAVIIVEAAIFKVLHTRYQEKGVMRLNQEQMDHEVRESASQMMNSATFGQIIILIVYIPILSLVGIEGKMFKPMAMTVSFAIIGALVLSLTYIPVMSALFLPKKTSAKKNISDRMMDLFQRIYKPSIEFAIRHSVAVVVAAVILFGGAVALFSRMGAEFLPTLEEGDFAFHSMLPEGSTVDMSVKNNAAVEKILMKFPEVKQVVCKTGTTEIPTDPMAPFDTDVIIVLKEKKEWTTTKSYQGLMDTMLSALNAHVPGVAFEAIQPIEMRFNELMTGVRQDVAVKIFGENIDSLPLYALQVAKVIRSIDGAQDPQVERTSGMPQVSIQYDRSRIAQYGLNLADLNRMVRTAFAGEAAGVVFEDERRFDLVVRLEQADRQDIDDVRNLFVPLPSGGQIPLQQVADIDYSLGANQISREDAKRRIVVGFNVSGRDVKSIVSELQQKLDKEVKLPVGYYFTFGGSFKNLEEANNRLAVAVPAALLLIFVLLFFTFNSFREATLIYTAIPMSAIGGIVALWLRDMPFSISAGVGFIALFGVAVLNGIVLLSTFNQLEKEGITDIIERVSKGTQIRLRPVLMTASVASLGFLPMAISTSAGAEVQRPLATVVIGGLITATALTLIVLPALYLLFSSKKKISAPVITTALLLFLLSQSMNAQTPASRILSLDSCTAMALKNNPALQSSQLQVTQQEKLQKTGFDLGKTQIFYENEDLIKDNSSEGILKIGFSQTIDFPTTYLAQSKLNRQQTGIAETNRSLTEKELIRDVRFAYFDLWLVVEKQKLWQQQDSVFASFADAATLRFSAGETNKLELISSQAKRKEIQLALQAAISDVAIAQQELMQLLNTTELVLPVGGAMEKLQEVIIAQSTAHPFLNVYQQRISLAGYQKKVAVNKLLPDLSLRYFNQNWYGKEPGYRGYSFAVGIPLFFWAQQGKIQGAKLQQQIAQKDFESATLQFNAAYNKALLQYSKQQQLLQYYESAGLRQADELLNNATLAFRNGEIGYLEYTALLSQGSAIRSNYLTALNNYNQAVIQINYFTNK
ncbi:MAG: CusA/CzcA family heavy metal efflux RND transporter [Chitinophagales bacterium]